MKTIKSLLIAVIVLTAVNSSYGQTATELYNEGLQLKKDSKPSLAAEKFKKAIAMRSDYTEAYYEYGWCLNDLKEYNDAIYNLRQARNGWDDIPKVFFELGYAFEKTIKYDSAIVAFNRCLELKPDYSGAHRELGYIFYDKEDYVKALQYFKRYEETAKDPIVSYLYWYRKGFMLNNQKDYMGSRIALKKSLEFKTDNFNTWLELGFGAKNLKADEESIGYYKKAMELDPSSYIPYNGIGEVYRDIKKDMDEAMVWYQKSLDKKAKERKACFGMGYCLNSKEQYTEAIPYLRTAIEQEPTYTAAYVELGFSYYKVARHSDALSNLKKALELNPKNENARYYSALVYISQSNKIMAQKMVDELKELSSTNAAELQKKVNEM